MVEIGLSLGILYSENRTHGIKENTERVRKHAIFSLISFLSCLLLFLRIAYNVRRISEDEYFLFTRKLCTHKFLII